MTLPQLLLWWPALPALWLIIVNLRAFGIYRLDKQLAVEELERVPESQLLAYVAWGGGLGALVAMRRFRHKTRKQPFQSRFWGIIGLQAAVAFGGFLAWIVVH